MCKKLLLFLICILALPALRAQEKEFWFVAPQAGLQTFPRGGFVFTNTSTLNTATVTIHYYKTGLDETFTIPPGEGSFHNVTPAFSTANIENLLATAGTVVPGGVHITSTENLVVYYVFDAQFTKDMFSLKGSSAMGTNFIVPQTMDGFYVNGNPGAAHGTWNLSTGQPYPNAFDQIDIMATEAGTTVTVTIPRDCGVNYTWNTYMPGSGALSFTSVLTAGTYTFNLNEGEVIKLMEVEHGVSSAINLGMPPTLTTLGGTKITSNKNIVVSSTEEVANHDMCADQIVPVDKVGTLYPLVKGYSDPTHPDCVSSTYRDYSRDRVYIIATEPNTQVYLNETPGGGLNQVLVATLAAAGDYYVYDFGDISTYKQNIFASSIHTTHPAYCLQTTSMCYHPGAAVLPTIYSVGANRLSYWQYPAPAANERNAIFVVFRDTCENYFEYTLDNGITGTLMSLLSPSPGPDELGQMPGISGWSYIRLTTPTSWDSHVVTITNSESVFSLGYYSGSLNPQYYAAYTYLSTFADWKFDPDTIWRCTDNLRPVTLMGGYAANYKWTLPDGTIKSGPNYSVLKVREPGMYILEMDQEYKTVIDTCWVVDITFNASIKRIPNKPAKIGVPQIFTVDGLTPSMATKVAAEWTFEGGTPSTSNTLSQSVLWSTTGQKRVTLHLSVTEGVGKNEVNCDTTIVMDLMLHEKNIGYFVDKDRVDGNHDGTNWENAFQQVYEALDSASQGDCIWVAEGEYQPKGDNQSFIMNFDSVEMYGGFGGWEADISERDFSSHKTVLVGKGTNVVTFDGASGIYSTPYCGVSRATRLDGFTVQGGTATNGAGILFTGGASGTVAYCIIKSNTATDKGGGVYIGGPYGGCVTGSEDPLLVNNEISGNNAATGGGIYNAGSAFTSASNTVAGNIAPSASGYYNDGGNADLRNTIIWGNLTNGAFGADVTNGGGTPIYSWCDIAGWSTALGSDGTHNIDKNPVYLRSGFDSEMNVRENANYNLSNASPAVDKGHNPYVLAGLTNRATTILLHPATAKYSDAIAVDLNYMNRIENDVVDMGAYEFHPDTTFPGLTHDIVIGTYPNMTTDPAAGIHHVIAHKNFTMTLTPAEGYSLDYITITTGSKYQDEMGGKIVTHNPDGTVTLIFKEVSDPLDVKISGISPTANISVENGYAIYAKDGNLYVQVSKAGQLNIYSVTGQLVKQQNVAVGTTAIPLAQGVYVVSLDNGAKQKVVVK